MPAFQVSGKNFIGAHNDDSVASGAVDLSVISAAIATNTTDISSPPTAATPTLCHMYPDIFGHAC
jgi:hypothetical protein